ncbi:unnamed protein product [Mytilus edulis]|uniref:Uncharacterized protein n=1 Tax=Mytilus edulis TaxID=6550 RepID=A0A8S3V740_MYTED|nr:unnamed protein product [Mytilus edulis]
MGLNNNVCCKCNYVYPLSNRNCPNCNHDPKYNPLGYDPYKRTPSQHLKHPPTVTVGEPCMVNPNNEEKIGIVLEHLREVCNIPEQRKWLVVWSDGIPYLYGMRLQQYVYVCSACEELVDTRKESLDDHTAKHNHDDSINFHRAFSDFIFRPGPGHIELNMAKCLLNFCWPILLPMVSALGFRTKKLLMS